MNYVLSGGDGFLGFALRKTVARNAKELQLLKGLKRLRQKALTTHGLG